MVDLSTMKSNEPVGYLNCLMSMVSPTFALIDNIETIFDTLEGGSDLFVSLGHLLNHDLRDINIMDIYETLVIHLLRDYRVAAADVQYIQFLFLPLTKDLLYYGLHRFVVFQPNYI